MKNYLVSRLRLTSNMRLFHCFIAKLLNGYTVLETVNSEINGEIEIREDLFGKRTMVAGGLAQSGKEVEKLWLKVISNWELVISNCLILGLGAGTVAKLISQKYPNCKITGIEIDPGIIQLGYKYFNLKETSSLHIIVTDAIDWINNLDVTLHREYDLILIDIYKGDQFPKEAESEIFLETLKKTLSPKGLVIINRLYYHVSDKQQTDEFGKKLRAAFNQVEEKEINWNKFFFVR